MKELQPVPLHMKRESQVPKYLNLVNKGGGTQGLERALGQLLRIMAKAQVFDFQCFLLMDGLGTISSNVIIKGMQEDADVSKKYDFSYDCNYLQLLIFCYCHFQGCCSRSAIVS